MTVKLMDDVGHTFERMVGYCLKDSGKDWHQYYAVGSAENPMDTEYLRKCVDAYEAVFPYRKEYEDPRISYEYAQFLRNQRRM